MLWTERSHQCTTFQTFGCSNESSPNSSCHFWNHKVRVYSNFASLFSVMKDNSSVFFISNFHILWTEWAQRREIFRLLSGWVKTHEVLHVIFKTTIQFSLNFASLLSFMKDNSSVLFLAGTLYDLDKRSPSKCKISDFWLLT